VTTSRFVCAFAMVLTAAASPNAGEQQPPAGAAPVKAKVDIVQTVGCVERRGAGGDQWWLIHAASPTVTRDGVFTTRDVEAAKQVTRGTRDFRLVGEADYLDREGLLRSQNRAEFTRPEQANATGALREGRTVLVKGLLIKGDEERINLLAVTPLADACR
jgi:hypothetical protein